MPLEVSGAHRFTDIAVGGITKCALDATRAAYCWGANVLGTNGDGSFLAKRGPSAVVGGHHWQTIS
ncbi:MAG TPA: hypothetical protein VFK16_06550, partial [Gemmatimonadaceae bacterium]|nr:hypothetical protein [Gemmatimonadaceae bacterium]